MILFVFIGYKIVWKEKNNTASASEIIDLIKINEVKRIIKSNSKYNKRFAFFINMKVPLVRIAFLFTI